MTKDYRYRRRYENATAVAMGRLRVKRARARVRAMVPWARSAVLVIVVIAIIVAFWIAFDSRFFVYGANVVGAKRLSHEEVFRASQLSSLHILWARASEVEARILAAEPSLESVRVACRLPAACTIWVVERRPRIVWEDEGEKWWVDAAGVVFPAQGGLPEGWVVRGVLPRQEDGKLREQVRVAIEDLWAAGMDMSQVFYYVPERGLALVDKRGWRVNVGEGPGMARRLKVLESLAADLQARGLIPKYVDVRFADAPYYSLTNEW